MVYSRTTLSKDGVYTWTVRSVDGFGRTSGLTGTWVFTVDATAPGRPVLLSPVSGTVVSTRNVTFGWQAGKDNLSGVVSYTLKVGTQEYSATDTSRVVTLPGGRGLRLDGAIARPGGECGCVYRRAGASGWTQRHRVVRCPSRRRLGDDPVQRSISLAWSGGRDVRGG